MNDANIWHRALTYTAALILVPVLMWLLSRAFPPSSGPFPDYDLLYSRYRVLDACSQFSGLLGLWGAIFVMLRFRVGNTPWLIGAAFGWLVLAPLVLIVLCTLPRPKGLLRWREFWRFHELKYRISTRFFGPLYVIISLLGIVSTIVIVRRLGSGC